MVRKKFKLWHSVLGLTALLGLQGVIVTRWPVGAAAWLILVCALVGSIVTIYVATEAIEEVRNAGHMLILLCAIVAQFILFFAFEYYFLMLASPSSFPMVPQDPTGYLLHSIMIFVFNPLYLPTNFIGRALLLINTASALGLVLFTLQNIWQFRGPNS